MNPEHRDIGKPNAHESYAVRPLTVTFGVAVVVGLTGGVLSAGAPDLFGSLGGWMTVVVIVAVASLAGSMTVLHRMRKRSAMPDERAEPPRD